MDDAASANTMSRPAEFYQLRGAAPAGLFVVRDVVVVCGGAAKDFVTCGRCSNLSGTGICFSVARVVEESPAAREIALASVDHFPQLVLPATRGSNGGRSLF